MNNGTLVLERIKAASVFTKEHIYFFCKRLIDISISIFGLIILFPLMVVIKIIFLFSGDFNSILFKQTRIGKNGNLFDIYKFRTMVPNADEILIELLKQKKYKVQWEKSHKFEEDPRITKIGKFLRKTSIDELPQLINVFKGEMSLIGNRPYLVSEKTDMGEFYQEIVKTKPGITGMWQTSGRSSIPFKNRLKLEQHYSTNCSFIMDLKIFFKTFVVVLFGRGAK